MNYFDSYIFSLLSQFADHSFVFNKLVRFFTENYLLTSVPIVSLLWWSWFKSDGRQISNRKLVVSIIVGCAFACAVFIFLRETRLLTPFRPRPMCNPEIMQQLPYYGTFHTEEYCRGASSSFPSGHTAILSVIGVGLLYVSRVMGILCLIYVFISGLLRVFIGFHYPTDIIAGGAIGALLFYLANVKLIENTFTSRVLKWSDSYPHWFYSFLFAITFEIATFFYEGREILRGTLKLLKLLFQ